MPYFMYVQVLIKDIDWTMAVLPLQCGAPLDAKYGASCLEIGTFSGEWACMWYMIVCDLSSSELVLSRYLLQEKEQR